MRLKLVLVVLVVYALAITIICGYEYGEATSWRTKAAQERLQTAGIKPVIQAPEPSAVAVSTGPACGPFYAVPNYYLSGFEEDTSAEALTRLVLAKGDSGTFTILAKGYGSFTVANDTKVTNTRLENVDLRNCASTK